MKNPISKIVFGLFLLIAVTFALWFGFSSREIAEPENPAQTEAPALSDPSDEQPVTEEQKLTSSSTSVEDSSVNYTPDSMAQNESTSALSQAEVASPERTSCTIAVRCDKILEKIDRLKPEKRGIIPENGIILASRKVEFAEGENVFDLTLRVMRENNIHLEFVKATAYNSAYIEGIANIYEKDCGSTSGWIYKVNGSIPSMGCSSYILKDGDVVEWVYTCNLGKDL